MLYYTSFLYKCFFSLVLCNFLISYVSIDAFPQQYFFQVLNSSDNLVGPLLSPPGLSLQPHSPIQPGLAALQMRSGGLGLTVPFWVESHFPDLNSSLVYSLIGLANNLQLPK